MTSHSVFDRNIYLLNDIKRKDVLHSVMYMECSGHKEGLRGASVVGGVANERSPLCNAACGGAGDGDGAVRSVQACLSPAVATLD